MTQRIALIDDTGLVENVAVFPDDFADPTWDGHQAVPCGDQPIGPGWTYAAGTFTPPPTRGLTADPASITSTQTSLVTFTDTYADAPAQVTFTVNGATSTVNLTDGTAELEVTPSGIGDIIVSVDQPVPSIIITVTEA